MVNAVPNAEIMTANDTQVLDRKLHEFGNHDNFVAPRELTVTITLNEYRNLVMAKAVNAKTIDDLNDKNYKLERKVQTLMQKLNTTTDADTRSADEVQSL